MKTAIVSEPQLTRPTTHNIIPQCKPWLLGLRQPAFFPDGVENLCGWCPQERALRSNADILISGGSAGGGKTYGLLLEPLHHVEHTPGFAAVIFRRIIPSILNEGGMWDQSEKVYRPIGGKPIYSPSHEWKFPLGTTVRFSHLQHDRNKDSWTGSQVALLEFDQIEEFEASQFWFLFSRLRTDCGIQPYVRATANPVPKDDALGGWVHRLIEWWIDPNTGLAIPERSGQKRWIVRRSDDTIAQFATKADAAATHPAASGAQSLSFIRMALEDNLILERNDPHYRAKLELLPRVERERLLGGNWHTKAEAGKVFNRAWFRILDAEPAGGFALRYWDKAGTEQAGKNDPDWSAGVKLKRLPDGRFVVTNVIRGQWTSLERNRVIKQVAMSDGRHIPIWVEQEPGSGGKESAEITIRDLAGWDVAADRVTGDRIARMGPLSAQAEAGNVYLLRGDWNESFLNELHTVPDGRHDDQATASAGAFNKLTLDIGGGGTVRLSGY